MRDTIDAFGGDGEYEVRFHTKDGPQAVMVRRDVWVDRGDGERWVVWAQQRSTDDALSTGDGAKGDTLGSIVVTNPVAIAFLEQLGALIANPAAFQHEPVFAVDTARPDGAG